MAKSSAATDIGLLVLRVGLGASFLAHGWPKVVGGPAKWTKLGAAMSHVGIDFAPTFWGAAASFSELVGGGLLIVGLLTRPAAFLLLCTMSVAATMHLDKGEGFTEASHALECGVAFLSVLITGGGRFALDRLLRGK